MTTPNTDTHTNGPNTGDDAALDTPLTGQTRCRSCHAITASTWTYCPHCGTPATDTVHDPDEDAIEEFNELLKEVDE